MESDKIITGQQSGLSEAKGPPKASAWFWRPWYAKLWWGCGLLYWGGKLGSYWSPALDAVYSTTIAGMLNIVFYPFTMLIVLGVGFVRGWMSYKGLEWGTPTADQLFPKRSVGGWRDPAADPLDPRSTAHWLYLDDTR